jgi:hypothetical protein
MVSLRRFISYLGQVKSRGPTPSGKAELIFALVSLLVVAACLYLAFGELAYAGSTKIPGTDASDQLEAAGTLLRIIDTGLFKWGARIFAGICIMSSGWALKEQRFGIAIICVIGAIIFGTAPTWVKNIFDIGGGNGVFSQVEHVAPKEMIAKVSFVSEEPPHA